MTGIIRRDLRGGGRISKKSSRKCEQTIEAIFIIIGLDTLYYSPLHPVATEAERQINLLSDCSFTFILFVFNC